ncbi:MAG TPA: hypothetical protein VHY35_10525 [Stellaceae bacterium]|jgi:hypothetical protein|nr:hypothetical protein [Stellaceae bacterium]
MTLRNGRPHGGKRTGAGRPLNPIKSAKLAFELLERGKQTLGEDGAPHPLDFALAIMWDPNEDKATRLDMLKTVLPYCSPRLSSVEVKDPDAQRMTVVIRDFSDRNAILSDGSTLQITTAPTIRDAIVSEVVADDMESSDEGDDS